MIKLFQPLFKKYRVVSSHCGDAPEIYSVFYCDNDDEAKQELKRICKLPEMVWDNAWLERIDQEEKITRIT